MLRAAAPGNGPRASTPYPGKAYRRGVRTQHDQRRTAPHPTALQWLWYALGGRLPAELSPWVLADTTEPGWVRRHLTRTGVQLLPVLVVCVVAVPVPLAYRLSAAVGGLLMGLMFSLAFIVETNEHRVVKAGYPAGTATAYRERAAHLRQQQETERRRAAAAKRAARYRDRRSH